MRNIKILLLLLLTLIISCNVNQKKAKTEKTQKHRDKVDHFANNIHDVKTNLIFSSLVVMSIIDNYFIITDLKASANKGMHIFDKNTFEYITSAGIIGNGPGEITRIGRIGIDEKNKIIWAPDYGKMVMWQFLLDSIFQNDMYRPTNKLEMNRDLFFANKFDLLNDSLTLGNALHVLNNNDLEMAFAKLNINTNNTIRYGYAHPKAIGKRSQSFSKISVENNFYVNCYRYCDLMTICDMDGDLKYNVYGANWYNEDLKKSYFLGVDIYKSYIIASYNGDVNIIYNESGRPEGNYASKFLIFEKDGDYVRTIETGHKFDDFCIDKENARVIVYFADRENPLGYFNLNLD